MQYKYIITIQSSSSYVFLASATSAIVTMGVFKKLVGFDRQVVAIQSNHQFAEVLAILTGLNHGSAAVDDDRSVLRVVRRPRS